jgi:very-short-patch-repair endonuclease
MKIDLFKPEINYPLILIPDLILKHIEQEKSIEELIDFVGSKKPEKIEFAHSKIFSIFEEEKIKIPLVKKTIFEINKLTINSQDHELENYDFYINQFKLPKKPKFNKTTTYNKKNIDWNFYIKILIGTTILSTLGWITIGTFIIYLLNTLALDLIKLDIPKYLLPILLNIMTIIFLNKKIWEKEQKELISHDIYELEENERKKLLNEYLLIVNKLTRKANEFLEIKWEDEKKLILENRNEIEIQIISEILKEKNINLIPIENNRKGKSEIYFLQYLYKEFGNLIKVDLGFQKTPYIPDFVLFIQDLNLYIDIEIDEPYVLNTGEAIHHDRSIDYHRNMFFNQINWIVIRFSEKQIIESPKDCIKLITEVVNSIRNKSNYISTDLRVEKCWTYEEALIMSSNNYRNTYLNLLNN